MDAAALAVFAAPGRELTPTEAASAAEDLFGVRGAATPLYGECDQNFRLEAPSGETFLLKISHAAEEPIVTDLQTQVLDHLARTDPGLPVPRLAPGRGGALQTRWSAPGGEVRTVRLMSFLPGECFHARNAAAHELHNVGAAMARLGLALRSFRHPAEDRELLWDVQSLPRLAPMIETVADPVLRALAQATLDRFEDRAAPMLPRLRRQAIHNDINRGNVLLDEEGAVTGLIDFGDALRAPLIQDLAVCGAYHLRAEGEVFADVAHILAGYAPILPLRDEELAVLPTLIAARMAMGILIAAWRATIHPGMQPLTSGDRSIAGLAQILDGAEISP